MTTPVSSVFCFFFFGGGVFVFGVFFCCYFFGEDVLSFFFFFLALALPQDQIDEASGDRDAAVRLNSLVVDGHQKPAATLRETLRV